MGTVLLPLKDARCVVVSRSDPWPLLPGALLVITLMTTAGLEGMTLGTQQCQQDWVDLH